MEINSINKTKTMSSQFEIAGRRVGGDSPCYVIAEAGVAHFGDVEKALRLVDLAVEAKADSVKFQVFDVDAMIASEAGEWRERLGARSLPYGDFERIKRYCEDMGIVFFATAHDEPSLEFLSGLDVPVFKIGSGEFLNWPFIRKTAAYGKPVILSTGMYSFDDVKDAVATVLGAGNGDLGLLHCVTAYPTPPKEVNLRVISQYREAFGGVIGYSDHTAGFHIPLASVAMGAKIVEKHISLDFDVPNAQDWKVSCGPHDLTRFVSEIREVEAALGIGNKQPTDAEIESLAWARKSLVLKRDVSAGMTLSPDLLVAKRPGTGISPDQLDNVVGSKVITDLAADTVLRWEDIQ